jgi:hypothetical protein
MKSNLSFIFGSACLALLTLAGTATAQSVSREQAWSQCLKETDRVVGEKTTDNEAQRTAAFKACMTRLGFAGG